MMNKFLIQKEEVEGEPGYGFYSKGEKEMKWVARRTRLELATPCVTGRYSNQLNYRRTIKTILI